MFNQLFASPENDLPGALLLVYAFWAFLRIFEADRDKEAWLLQLLVAGVLAVMTKIATAPVLLLLPIAGYAVFARDRRRVWGLARDPILLCLCDRRRRLGGHGHHLIGMHRLSRGIDLHRRPALDAAHGRYR